MVPITEARSYMEQILMSYPGDGEVVQDAGTMDSPTRIEERPIRQKVKVSKDIATLEEAKSVWHCLNCGYENEDGDVVCGYCGHERTSEETKTIQYAHDTYSAVHSENLAADGSGSTTSEDWLTSMLNGWTAGEAATDIQNFRFKAYLKSNRERLYRNADGEVVWMDRNGNLMAPQYEDTNSDGNYDTFTWKYESAYGGKSVDFPEKDILSDTGVLESANVQKIYTMVPHETDSMTTSARANSLWDTYNTPQGDSTAEVGEKEGFTTSERGTSGNAIDANAALYSYNGYNVNRTGSDRINESQNSGYTRVLETTIAEMEDGAGSTRDVETYNYEKFFDAIYAANSDIWDNDMHSTYTGDSMENYPGQHWMETFYEKYQMDDADEDYTLANADGSDSDGTAGGDKDTSFKPFAWIRALVFGDRSGYEQYPADNNGGYTENTINTSDYARANAEASDAVRQFAAKWYLEDEAAKLMVNNGYDEDIAKADGTIAYDEEVYDEALFNAIAKSYNYLKPFYYYDLDTIYSVEWDSAQDGGTDGDYTTLSIDYDDADEHYNISAYLPYGTYVIVEQQPARVDGSVNDWENRSYTIEKPKEVLLPSVYDAETTNETTDNYDSHYNYASSMDTETQAREDNYLIRFGEEWSGTAPNSGQDEREYVIRAHNYYGDYEIYKYGLDIDRINSGMADYGGISYSGGRFAYAGWSLAQEAYDPLKDYYDT